MDLSPALFGTAQNAGAAANKSESGAATYGRRNDILSFWIISSTFLLAPVGSLQRNRLVVSIKIATSRKRLAISLAVTRLTLWQRITKSTASIRK
jgi:hypothetical protein